MRLLVLLILEDHTLLRDPIPCLDRLLLAAHPSPLKSKPQDVATTLVLMLENLLIHGITNVKGWEIPAILLRK